MKRRKLPSKPISTIRAVVHNISMLLRSNINVSPKRQMRSNLKILALILLIATNRTKSILSQSGRPSKISTALVMKTLAANLSTWPKICSRTTQRYLGTQKTRLYDPSSKIGSHVTPISRMTDLDMSRRPRRQYAWNAPNNRIMHSQYSCFSFFYSCAYTAATVKLGRLRRMKMKIRSKSQRIQTSLGWNKSLWLTVKL